MGTNLQVRKHLTIPVVHNKGSVLLHEGQLKDHGLPGHPKVGSHVFIQATAAVAAGMGDGKASRWGCEGGMESVFMNSASGSAPTLTTRPQQI